MEYTIYKLTDTDGYFYIGSTTQEDLRVRRWNHIAMSKKKNTPMFEHFKKIGWDNVMIEEIEKGVGTKEDRLRHETRLILLTKDDEYCLNKRRALVDDKIQARREWGLKYLDKNRAERNQASRDYYYKQKYGVSESEYKSLSV